MAKGERLTVGVPEVDERDQQASRTATSHGRNDIVPIHDFALAEAHADAQTAGQEPTDERRHVELGTLEGGNVLRETRQRKVQHADSTTTGCLQNKLT